MTSLAERLAPLLYGPIEHVSEDGAVNPVMSPFHGFANVTMPKGMLEDIVKENNLPHGDVARLWLEAVFQLIKAVEGIDVEDPDIRPDRLAELKAERDFFREAASPGINAIKKPKSTCGVSAGRAIIRDLHTDEPTMPCAMLVHDCKRK